MREKNVRSNKSERQEQFTTETITIHTDARFEQEFNKFDYGLERNSTVML